MHVVTWLDFLESFVLARRIQTVHGVLYIQTFGARATVSYSMFGLGISGMIFDGGLSDGIEKTPFVVSLTLFMLR